MQNFKEFSLDEAHKIGSSVEVIKGSGKGIKGHIGEIRHGAFKGAPKTYTVYHGEHDAIQVPKEHIRAIKEDNDLDEARMSAAQRLSNAWDKQRAKSDASLRRTPSSIPKKEEPKKEVTESLDTHEMAMAHKDKASKALETSDMKSFHNHMSNHHESMGQWHESKGRHSAADREYAKAEEHHEKSLKPDNSRTVGVKNESAICNQCQSDPCICDDSHGFVSEAAQGHTIEAHGIRGMKGTPWRKTFKSHEHLSDWADKNDSIEVHATRELDGVKKKTNEEAELDEVFADQGSGSTAKDNAEYMKRRKAAGATKHKVSVTVSEKDHPMVSKRLEKQQKRVIVSADSKEEAVVRAKKFYSKQGYHVHDAEYHSPQLKTSMKTESTIASFNEFVSEMWHSGDAYKREFKRQEMEHELGHEDRAERMSGDSSHAVHINGKKWKSFATRSHAQNVANKIKGATVHKE